MKPNARRIAVLASGAIGSSIAADLIDAGHDITVIDQWPAHVETMREKGLFVRMKDREVRVPVRALHLCDLASANREFDVVLLASKSNDHRWLAELILPWLAPDGVLMATQNGMNDDSIAAIVGKSRTVGCVVELQAELFTPGEVQRNTTREGTWFSVGELDGRITPRVRELAELMRNVGRCDVTGNIYGAKWTKLVANSMTMGPFSLFGLRNFQAVALPGMTEISVRLGRESFAVGSALGYRIEPIFGIRADEFAGSNDENLVTLMQTLMSHVGGGRTAPIHDHLKGRVSEIAYISGVVARKGRELGIDVTCNAAVTALDARINRGELAMDAANLDLLKDLIAKGNAS